MTRRKAPKALEPPFEPVCGLDEAGVDDLLDTAEQLDLGTERFPWPDGLKDDIKATISGMTFMDAVKRKINDIVVEKAGPGLFNRGPYNLPLL